ncbi:MAG: NADH-quinone oxidoreductase subunit L [Elusimicrobia bacterium]|nr:NADH-quinone oxidoreductase subunit L [Elusimicrobiota bacterium]
MTAAQIPMTAWLLFIAPVTAILIGFFVLRPLKPEWTHWPILISCAIVTLCAFSLTARVYSGRGSFDVNFWRWAAAGDWAIDFGLRIDGPGTAVLSMVALVGSLIHVYAAGYMEGDPGFSRFFLVFHLFFLAMIGLLTANNYVQLYLFWEMVGVASYLLIGFWLHKESARKAALKAFLTNRVGDFGFLLALLLILVNFHVAHFHLLYVVIGSQLAHGQIPSSLPLIGLLLIWAACAKSAQFPLYFWLPDAMEGPTPTSALMHAATMVTAGVFLLIRSWPLIAAVPYLPHLIAGIGAFTAVFAALLAATKRDLKRILAYSTVSHLGLMMLALGMGDITLAIFHLIVHGFFKAALFLCAGNIGHAVHKPTVDVDEVGGWAKALPATYVVFWICALSLAGIWPMAGFYSKDAIIDFAREGGGWIAWAAPLISFGSAFYIFRMLLLTFHGDRPEQNRLQKHPHEAGPMMVVPIAFLAVGAALVGWIAPALSRLVATGWIGLPVGLAGMTGVLNLPGNVSLPALSVRDMFSLGGGMAALGAASAYYLTMIDAGFDWRWRKAKPGTDAAFDADLGWKTLVAAFASGVAAFARVTGRVFDKGVWDGLIESGAEAFYDVSDGLATFAQGRLNDALWWMAAGALLILGMAIR